MAVESTAVALTDRIDALAAALRLAGVSQEQSSSLLASASAAAMQALMLDALLDDRSPPAAARPEPSLRSRPHRHAFRSRRGAQPS